MIGIGDQTGALEGMLGKIADFHEAEADSAIAGARVCPRRLERFI